MFSVLGNDSQWKNSDPKIVMVSYTSYRILPEHKLILTNFQGKIHIRDVIQTNLQFLSDQDYDSGYDLIMDFSGSIAIAYKMDLMEFVDFFKKTVNLKKRVKVAMVISSPNQNYLIIIYKPIASLLKMEVESFSHIDPCLDWLGHDGEDRQKIKSSLLQLKEVPGM